MKKITVASATCMALLSGAPALGATDKDIESLRAEIQGMKRSYEERIRDLEYKLSQMENEKDIEQQGAIATLSGNQASNTNNAFNPAIGVVLNGKYTSFSEDNGDIKGFATPEEGARGSEGLKLGESEIHMAANVDDKFRGSLTTSFVNEDGSDGLEIEEAYVQTLPGLGLPSGVSVKAGRAYWTLGYLNEQHTHMDDFVDRPLPYRVFLNNSYNDDGVEISYVLPTDFYSEVGGGLFRGDDYPFGSASDSDNGAWSVFARIGGDIGFKQTWRLGGYVLSGQTSSRASNEDVVSYNGDTSLYVADLRYTWAPNGNPNTEEVLIQGEYFWRDEDGSYEDTDASTGAVAVDDQSSGWYAQSIYKFHPQWRVGYRYSQLQTPNTPSGLAGSILDANGHNPDSHTVMMDWSNSEFSRFRLQYNYEKPTSTIEDNQVMLQYIMSIGAHAAHKY